MAAGSAADGREGAAVHARAFLYRHAGWLLPLAFAVLVTLLGQWWSPEAFDPDEGINLGKGALVAAGYHPYAEIWNDQPPVLTYILAGVQTVVPWSVGAARVAILAFACLLLFSVFVLVERSAGRAEAVAAIILLGTAPLMWRLSISVMIGLPAVALAVAACAIVYGRDRAAPWRAVAAGLVFALSLQTKLFTAAALPAFLMMAYLADEAGPRGRRAATAATALAATVAGFVAIAWASGEPFLAQLIGPHVAGAVRSDYSFIVTAGHFAEHLVQQPFVVIAALLALTPAGRPAGRLRLAWLAWLGVAAVSLLGHTPLRYHHMLLLLVPLVCLGGEASWRVLRAAWPARWRLARYRTALAVIVPVVAVAYLVLMIRPFHDDETPGVNEAAERLAAHAVADPWVATDQPFDAFVAGLLVPPELVVFSIKRIETGNLTPEMLLATIAARKPGQVMLRRTHADRTVRDYLERTYVPLDPRRLHYLRPDLAN
ncbi:MAG: glycosyltransferase family 39 protein [Bauldia sp.]|nr:glycosyltransferase family 39 protein [Bauldia sp.]